MLDVNVQLTLSSVHKSIDSVLDVTIGYKVQWPTPCPVFRKGAASECCTQARCDSDIRTAIMIGSSIQYQAQQPTHVLCDDRYCDRLKRQLRGVASYASAVQ